MRWVVLALGVAAAVGVAVAVVRAGERTADEVGLAEAFAREDARPDDPELASASAIPSRSGPVPVWAEPTGERSRVSSDAPPRQWAANVRAYLDSGPEENCFDLVLVGDGYLQRDLDDGTYWRDVERVAKGVVAARPFCWYLAFVNVRAVFLPSRTRGCDVDEKEDRVDTALDSTFKDPKDRSLLVRNVAALREALRGAGDADAVLVMINARFTGGSAGSGAHQMGRHGFRFAAFTSNDPSAAGIALHELGHSLANLADEYVSPEDAEKHTLPRKGDILPMNVQVGETLDLKNRETLARTAKWGRFLKLPGADAHTWAHEGGYYRDTGMWRPWPRCRMLDSDDPFCPVCCEQMAKAIFRHSRQTWDEAAYHAAHPLSEWAK